MKKKPNKVSLGDIARVAGVSSMAVSRALLNKPGVSEATRERILGIAKTLGYAPDARLSSLMAQIRKTTSRDLLPIAWLNTCHERDAWQTPTYHTPYMEGARARAQELGYKIEDIWAHEPGLTMKRLSRILYQRGIEGVIVTFPARHFRLDWDHLASVALGTSLLAPGLHRVTADLNFNLQLALKSLRRLNYNRIGICLWPQVESASHYTIRATARDLYFSASPKERIPPLFHTRDNSEGKTQAKEMLSWLERYRLEVIVGHDGHIKPWLEGAGYCVPEDIGLVHLAVDDDVLDWAGIQSRRRETGATAVDQLVGLMRNRQYGVPKVPLNILIRGTWQNGKTLRVPQPC
jgi:DNA-binding LacI/PurR family transcriptional regulator